MKIRIVADSSCDILNMEDIDFVSVPLTIRTAEKEYIDNSELDVKAMVKELKSYKGRSYTSCPNPNDWERAFEGADKICVFTISKGVSGTYNSAFVARNSFLEKHPKTKIHIVNTLSAGPEITLAIWKMKELLQTGMDFDRAYEEIDEYVKHTSLLFALKSLHNFVQNGRVSKIAAMACVTLNINILGQASPEGMLELRDKFRGDNKTVNVFMQHLSKLGYCGGRALIGHVLNEEKATELCSAIKEQYPKAQINIHPMRGLCSYYAEEGGILIGFERGKVI